ncbi:type IV pilin-like G/H family protein [Microcoleus sp. B4-C5]|uniref:type IV pilin-like G/H family protein n=1 Tax=unclassified Microcoleus TaxID=2642155 RepID=UPI002FD3BE62
MPRNAAKASKQPRVKIPSFLDGIPGVSMAIQCGLVASLMLCWYDFKYNTTVFLIPRSAVAEKEILLINQRQQAYYAENNQFSSSLKGLGLESEKETYDHYYKYRTRLSMGPVQTLHNQSKAAPFEMTLAFAQPRDRSIKRWYMGAVVAFKENGSNLLTTMAAVCESDARPQTIRSLPTFDGKEIHCPSGTNMLR